MGPAFAGYLLVYYGYEAGVVQLDRAIEGLRLMMSWIPSAIGLVSASLVMFYGINREVEQKMDSELSARKTAEGTLST
ncbi:MAG: hypothetical protein J6386_00290 [Candidatus Synoicihabitans palmerolidicus]|nr:hypothetical protein [Candidatus Synoicihabitans palmerolidicus]